MTDYTINYTYNDRVLTVQPVNSQFEIVGAVVGGRSLTTADMEMLMEDVRETYRGDGSTTPKKLFEEYETDSPSSIVDTSVLYDAEFIDRLRQALFSADFNPVSTEHTPVLLSIEGNIGAGKSK